MSAELSGSLPASEVIQAFQSAAATALQELARCETVRCEAEIPSAIGHAGGIVAAVQLLRELPGTLFLVVPAETACQLAMRYLPANAALTAEIVNDVAGEFANVIAGQAKTILKGTPFHFRMSIPVVTSFSHGDETLRLASVPLVAAIACEAGTLAIFVALAPCPNA
jgi:chemotaxis protein CheX